MITVALPNFAIDIAWLAMESLCRQETDEEWELIVYEDSSVPLGEDFYNKYLLRLQDAGCKWLTYKYSKERIPLNQKWITMAEKAHPNSLGIMTQASDCYSEPDRIQTAVAAFTDGVHWIHSYQGCFYNIPTGEMMKYKMNGFTGINIAISIAAMLEMPKDHEQWSSVDWWLWNSMPESLHPAQVHLDESDNWQGGLNTDGYNRISTKRYLQYANPQPPFHHTYLDLYGLLPGDVCDMLDKLKQNK